MRGSTTMRNLYLAVIFILALGMLSALLATSGSGQAGAQAPKPLTGSAADFKRAQFDNPTRIDNKWLPLKPGVQFVYEGSAFVEGEKGRQTRRVVSTVTDVGKQIAGVRTLVVLDKDYTAGKLGESVLAFYAQDNAGNVWLLGEYPEEYENGKFAGAPTWITGKKGARAGIAMLANPRLGTPAYSQGYAPPPVDINDRARVYKTGQQTCVSGKCYKNVLVIEEFEPGAPGAYQLEYYVSGVGNVRAGWRGAKEEEKETLALVKRQQLSAQALANARTEALKLDKNAYKRSGAVYGKTPKATPL